MNTATNLIITCVMLVMQIAVAAAITPFRVKQWIAYSVLGFLTLLDLLGYALISFNGNYSLGSAFMFLMVLVLLAAAVFMAEHRDARVIFTFFFADLYLVIVGSLGFMLVFVLFNGEPIPLYNVIIRCTLFLVFGGVMIHYGADKIKEMQQAKGSFWKLLSCVTFLTDMLMYFLSIYPTSIERRSEDFLYVMVANLIASFMSIMLVLIIYNMYKNQQQEDMLSARAAELSLMKLRFEQEERQYKDVLTYYEQIKKVQRDFRSFFLDVKDYVKSEDYEALDEKIKRFSYYLPELSTMKYCDIIELNTLFNYYSGVFRDAGIPFSCKLKISALKIESPIFLCLLLGNALDNALEAVLRMEEGEKFISIEGKLMKNDFLVFRISNSLNGQIEKNADGKIMTHKRGSGHGIGLSSIKEIAKEHRGWVSYDYDEGVFNLKIMLKAE